MAYLGNAPVVGDSTNSFKLLDDIASFTLTFDATDTSVVSISGDTLSFTNHRFVTGQKVTYTDGGGTAIGGLTDETSYFIIKVDQNTIKLATNASNAASSTAIDLTSGAAGGSHTLKVAFDGVNTKFKATFNNGKKAKISRAAQITLSINGVIQQPQDSSSPSVGYGVEADSTIVFSTAPAATDKVFASFIGEVAASFDLTDNTIDNFTGDGSTTIFNLSKEVPSSQDVLVTLDGVTQHPSDGSTTRSYSVIDQALTFVSAPATGVAIQARHIGFSGATTSAVTGFYGRTGNAALINTDDISVQNISAGIATFNTIAVGGTVSIGGTLTYEDVTNIDSVGLVTARNGIVVGSGITLSKDGDGFFTGVVTATSYAGSGANLTGIDTDLVSDTSPQLGGNLDVNTKNIVFGDSGGATDDRLTFGASTDLSIYHDGSHSRIDETGTGNLMIQSDNAVFIKKGTSENIAIFNADGAVELYHDSNLKFNTNSAGCNITGSLAFLNESTNISILDNGKAKFGNGDDLQLYHDGSNSYIDETGTGGLLIRSGDIYLRNPSNVDMIHAQSGGYVKLYHDGSERVETTSTGITVTGAIRANYTSDPVLVLNSTNTQGAHIRFLYDGTENHYVGAGDGFTPSADREDFAIRFYDRFFFSRNGTNCWYIDGDMHFIPASNGTYDIGRSDTRVRNIYTSDLHLSNNSMKDTGGNDVDGTWGDYTIQEGESDLFLINNRSGKKYKFNLTEVS